MSFTTTILSKVQDIWICLFRKIFPFRLNFQFFVEISWTHPNGGIQPSDALPTRGSFRLLLLHPLALISRHNYVYFISRLFLERAWLDDRVTLIQHTIPTTIYPSLRFEVFVFNNNFLERFSWTSFSPSRVSPLSFNQRCGQIGSRHPEALVDL